MLSSLFPSFTVHADAPEAKDENVEESKEEGEKEEGGEEEPEPEEEEEEEPEDVCLSSSCLVRHGMAVNIGINVGISRHQGGVSRNQSLRWTRETFPALSGNDLVDRVALSVYLTSWRDFRRR
jgi:hypothetical protein